MPIEIREIIIKTQVQSTAAESRQVALKDRELSLIRKQLLEECKRFIAENTDRNNYKR